VPYGEEEYISSARRAPPDRNGYLLFKILTRRKRMTEIFEYMREKFDWVAGRILELFTGLTGFKLEEVKERTPEVRRVAGARADLRLPPSGPRCDRY